MFSIFSIVAVSASEIDFKDFFDNNLKVDKVKDSDLKSKEALKVQNDSDEVSFVINLDDNGKFKNKAIQTKKNGKVTYQAIVEK